MPSPVKKAADAARWRIGRALVVERLNDDGTIRHPRPLRRLATRFDQAIVEAGKTAPWVLDADGVREYWASRDTGKAGNDLRWYIEKDTRIIDLMAEFWSPEVGTEDSVLELGPNAGPNLNRLHQLGYTKLFGVDINPRALEEMREAFPGLAAVATMWNGSFEEVLPTFDDDSFDVVFTSGVLMHLHPSSHDVMRQMARIARKHVCIIEPEETSNTYVFPRNYKRVFRRFGCRHLRSVLVSPKSAPGDDRDLWPDGYVVRLFAAPA